MNKPLAKFSNVQINNVLMCFHITYLQTAENEPPENMLFN